MDKPHAHDTDDKPSPSPYVAFDALARKLMGVPKSELDRREAEYQRQQAEKPKRGPKSKGKPE